MRRVSDPSSFLSIVSSMVAPVDALRAGRSRARLLPALTTTLILLCGLALSSVSVASAAGCPNEALRTGPSANLPDCRAYELVTPAEKGGAVTYYYAQGPASDGTSNLLVSSWDAILNAEDASGYPGGFYSITRTGEGWATEATMPPAYRYQASLIGLGLQTLFATSRDMRSTLWMERAKGQPEDEVDLYLRREGGVIEDIGPLAPPGEPSGEPTEITDNGLFVDPAGESADLSHVLFSMKVGGAGFYRWPFDTTTGGNSSSLYEYIGVGNSEPLLVGVDDEGDLISECGTKVGGEHEAHNAMSLDGRTVFFTAEECGSEPAVDEIFARVDNGEPGAHTVAISEPSSEDCEACDTAAAALRPARFAGAASDGSKVFFTTSQSLLGEDTSENIYEYDFEAPAGERVVRVSAGSAVEASAKAEVEGVVATSEDGSHVYFVARGALTSQANDMGASAEAGANNLYVFARDAEHPAGEVSFITRLSQQDSDLWECGFGCARPVDLTPSGDFLVFESVTLRLTPDDTSTAQQVFEYDAQSGVLRRVSIGEDGYNNDGNTDVAPASIVSPFYTEAKSSSYWGHLTVSADGAYVFFESSDGLTPQALNHRPTSEGASGEPSYANNVYEYHDGEVFLISDGRATSGVRLLGTDGSGGDVFFTTVSRLARQDTDTDDDIYDARVDGGFPFAPAPVECAGDACQGALSAAPSLLSPGSELQAGASEAKQAAEAKPAGKGHREKARRHARRRRARRHARRHRRSARGGKGARRRGRVARRGRAAGASRGGRGARNRDAGASGRGLR